MFSVCFSIPVGIQELDSRAPRCLGSWKHILGILEKYHGSLTMKFSCFCTPIPEHGPDSSLRGGFTQSRIQGLIHYCGGGAGRGICMHIYIYISIYIYIYKIYVCMYVCRYVCMHARLHICIYICMPLCGLDSWTDHQLRTVPFDNEARMHS